MFDIGGGELILIVLAIIVLFGPKKIPEVARMFGKGMQEFRKAQAQFTSQIRDIQTEITTSADLNAVPTQKPFRVNEADMPIERTPVSEIPKPVPLDQQFSEPKKPELPDIQ